MKIIILKDTLVVGYNKNAFWKYKHIKINVWTKKYVLIQW